MAGSWDGSDIKRGTAVLKVWISIFLSILFMLTLNFNYELIKAESIDPLTNLLDSLIVWLNGYGAASALPAAAIAYCIYRVLTVQETKRWKPSGLLIAAAIIFGFLNLCGLCMYHLDRLPFFYAQTWLFVMLPLWFSYSMMFVIAAGLAESGFYWLSVCRTEERLKNEALTCNENWKRTWAFSFIIIFLCWLPWMISYYPASMDWDVYRQLASFGNVSEYARSNHDPYFSSCIIGLCFSVGKELGNENLGIFIYVFLRSTAAAAVYAWVVCSLNKEKFPRILCTAVLAFYAITPVWGAYAKHAFKDTLAAALFCASVLSMVLVVKGTVEEKLNKKDCARYAFFSCLACLYRGNVIFALFPSTIGLSVILFRKRNREKGFIILTGCLCFLLFNSAIVHLGGIKPTEQEEALSLPFQVSARIVRDHYDEIGIKEQEALNGYLDYESMGWRYDPLVSDPVKSKVKKEASSEEKRAYWRTLAKLVTKYPLTSIEGIIASTYGYYSFTPKHDIRAGNMNANMAIFDWIKVNYFGEWFGNFQYYKPFEKTREWLHRWAQIWDRLPILSLTDTIAAYTWIVILLWIWFLCNRMWMKTIPVIAVLLIIATCIASPVNDCFRYYSLASASFPSLLLLLNDGKDCMENRVKI